MTVIACSSVVFTSSLARPSCCDHLSSTRADPAALEGAYMGVQLPGRQSGDEAGVPEISDCGDHFGDPLAH